MITEGFLDWAERIDGPAHKQYPQPNLGLGIAMHSVVGNLPNHGVPGRFFDAVDQASVMFILFRDGHVIQMYPVTSSTWTSGSYAANTQFWAIEAEGGGPGNTREKLTTEAEDSFIRIVTEWEKHTGRKALPDNLLQHKELVAQYGGGATACASDRYSNALARVFAGERYDLEEPMTPEERAKLDAVYAALTGGVPGVIEAWNENGNSVLISYNDLVFPHLSHGGSGGAAGGLADHRHYSNNPEATGTVIPQGADE